MYDDHLFHQWPDGDVYHVLHRGPLHGAVYMKVTYLTRNLPTELRDRLRVLATLKVRDLGTMEAVHAEALAIGLAVLEKERRLIDRPTPNVAE